MRPLIHHLTIAALIAALFPLAVVTVLSFTQYQKDVQGVEAYVGADSLEAARVASGVVGFLLDSTRSSLERIGEELGAGQVTRATLQDEVRREAQIQSIAVLDAQGKVRLSDRSEPLQSLADTPHVKAVLSGASVGYSGVYMSRALKVPAVAIAIPYRNGAERGILVARMSTAVMRDLVLSRLGDAKRAATYITDHEGNLIVHPDPSQTTGMVNLKDNPPVAAGIAGQSGWARFESTLYSAPRIGGHVPLEGPNWVVVSSRETGEAMVSARDRLNNLLAAAMLASLLAAIGAYLWGRRLARPLEALAGTMRHARDHGIQAEPSPMLDKATVHESITEYHTLGTSYNALAVELNRRFEENMLYQEELQAQNEELQAQNEEIHAQSEELQSQNEELAELTVRAESANRLKSAFLANMSHELRTPLNSIIGYTELVVFNRRLTLPEKVHQNLGIVLKNGRHLLSLINDILDLSKVEAGKATLYAEAVEVEALVQNVLATAEPLARDKGLVLVAESDAPVGQVVTDEAKVRQIVLNLVSNAIKFTPAGQVTVRLVQPGPEAFSITVSDTGVGIAPEHQEAVFEEFRQVDDSTTREAGGTGLGLAIARRLARFLGGDLVLAESTPGHGSTFRLTLPRRAATGETLPIPAPSAMTDVRLEDGKRLVVAIDDDPEMLQLVVERLKESPYQVAPASSGESGLALVRELKPYAVTLDVMMPGMDGWSVLRTLKADPDTAGIPVVILSFLDNKMVGFTLGAAAYLTKPVEQTDLMKALNELGPRLRESAGRVLIVDDDPDARGLYRELLSAEGLAFAEAADGREAIAAIAQERPALVILDLMMPHMDGFEVAAWLRARPETRDVPVIVVTAKELDREDVARLNEVQRVIRKGDMVQSLLVEDLRTLLDQARTEEREAT